MLKVLNLFIRWLMDTFLFTKEAIHFVVVTLQAQHVSQRYDVKFFSGNTVAQLGSVSQLSDLIIFINNLIFLCTVTWTGYLFEWKNLSPVRSPLLIQRPRGKELLLPEKGSANPRGTRSNCARVRSAGPRPPAYTSVPSPVKPARWKYLAYNHIILWNPVYQVNTLKNVQFRTLPPNLCKTRAPRSHVIVYLWELVHCSRRFCWEVGGKV